MSSNNPIIPPESPLRATLPARHSKLIVTVCILVALHVFILAGLLIQGCKREDNQVAQLPDLTNTVITPEPAPPQPAPLPEPVVVETNAPAPSAPTPEPASVPMEPITPAPAPAPPSRDTSAETKEYRVVRGDTFSKIARAHGVSVQDIADANPGVEPTKLRVGQPLQIPPAHESSEPAGAGSAGNGSVYVVKAGDNLIRIARAHGTSVEAIQEANGLKTHRILAGQKLKIPAGAKPPETEPTPPSTTPEPR